MRSLAALLAVALAATAHAQFRSTLCQISDAYLSRGATTVTRLLGCGNGFPQNVLWHLDRADSRTGALDARTYVPATGEGVVVYIVDMNIRREHAELMRASGSIVVGEVAVGGVPTGGCPGTGTCSPGASHATAIASVIGGATIGLAPGVKIVSIVAGPGRYLDAMAAIAKHAYEPGTPSFRTAVINISGGYTPSFTDYDELRDVVRRMTTGVDAALGADPNGRRFVFAVAAGNAPLGSEPSGCGANNTVIAYPAIFGPSIDGLIAVGAITRENEVWTRSCGGASASVEVLAPGADVFMASATANDEYLDDPAYTSGTSFAAPFVAAMAARILEREPGLSPADVERRLKASGSVVDGLPVPVMTATPRRRAVR